MVLSYVVLLCLSVILENAVADEIPAEIKSTFDDYSQRVKSGWDKDGVFVLTNETFDNFLVEKKALLVNFHGSFMQHSKEFHGIYADVATALNISHPDVFSAKVDGTEYRDLHKRYGVTGLPTVVLFPRPGGKQFFDYHGPRKAAEIVRWVSLKLQGSAVLLNSVVETQAFIDKNNVTVVGFFKDLESDNARTFKDTIEYVDGVAYGISGDEKVLKEFAPDGDQIILFKKFDEKRVEFDQNQPMNENNIGIFIMTHMLPDVNTFEWDHSQHYTHVDIKCQLMLYLSLKSSQFKEIYNNFKTVCQLYKGKALCFWINVDDEKVHNMFPVMDISLKEMPQMRAMTFYNQGAKMLKYKPSDIEKPFSLNGMEMFAESMVSGSRKPYYTSQAALPEHTSKPLKYVVGDEFTRVAFDKEKLVFIYFWAPWCIACNKTVNTVLTKLAEDLRERHDIVIAHSDYQANEYPGLVGDGFPCMWLFLKETNEQIEFKGNEVYEKMLSFITSDGTVNPEYETEEPSEKSVKDGNRAENLDKDEDDDDKRDGVVEKEEL